MKHFLAIVTRPGDLDPAAISAHKVYLQDLLAAGRLLQSGPFAEGPGGAYVFLAPDRAAAAALVAADPLLADPRAGIEWREWTIRLQATPGVQA